ncbi:MAG: aminotransferase class I/II-fold pyridoxal phosphate-dependent enzyme [Acidobacteria bacterium]|nr:aminotransferase class I/II-fold pyridoxal phosphate-dependent enzyme [Acidobacteriota bacterium]
MKQFLSQLSIFSGQPAFPELLHVGCPNVPEGAAREQLFQHINDMLDRRWLTNHGPLVSEFERTLAHLTGVRHAIAVCNGTLGLEIAAKACGFTGEVIVPSFTFVATAHALSWIGLTPVFADVDPLRHTIDPAQIEKLITPRTSAIVATHLWGNACPTEELEQIANRHGLQVIYDAAHAFGCSSRGKMIGSFGRAEVFSFHATKFINTFEGGAIVTNDDELADRIRHMMHFGFDAPDHVVSVGTNAKMSEVAAAMGLSSLSMMDEIMAANKLNYEAYALRLAGLSGLRLFSFDEPGSRNYQYVIAEVQGDGLSRDQLLEVLWSEGIRARRYFYPGCHRMEPYASQPQSTPLPVTERLSDTVLALPTGKVVGPTEIAKVCAIIRLALTNADEVKRRLGRAHQVAVA